MWILSSVSPDVIHLVVLYCFGWTSFYGTVSENNAKRRYNVLCSNYFKQSYIEADWWGHSKMEMRYNFEFGARKSRTSEKIKSSLYMQPHSKNYEYLRYWKNLTILQIVFDLVNQKANNDFPFCKYHIGLMHAILNKGKTQRHKKLILKKIERNVERGPLL